MHYDWKKKEWVGEMTFMTAEEEAEFSRRAGEEPSQEALDRLAIRKRELGYNYGVAKLLEHGLRGD